MRLLFTLGALFVMLGLTGCRSAPPPPPDDAAGVRVRAPGVNVDVRPEK
jgi:hypothetical protein